TSKKKYGFENRKRKKEMEEKLKKLPKLDSFCFSVNNKSKMAQNELTRYTDKNFEEKITIQSGKLNFGFVTFVSGLPNCMDLEKSSEKKINEYNTEKAPDPDVDTRQEKELHDNNAVSQ
ncbi:hypothetical protein PV326_002261, partial [Microctonus aethiopoides]